MIVRELVTRIGFLVDQSQVSKANHTISNFASGIEGKFSQVFDVVAGIGKFFQEAADDAVKIKDLARLSGNSIADIASLRQSFVEAGIEGKHFTDILSDLSLQVQYGLSNEGKLPEIYKQMQKNFHSFRQNGMNALTVLQDFIDYVRETGDEARKSFISIMLFGQQAGPRLVDFIEQGNGSLDEMIQRNIELGNQFEMNQEQLDTYREKINAFSGAWTRLAHNFVQNILPVLTSFIDIAGKVVGAIQPNYFTDKQGHRLTREQYGQFQQRNLLSSGPGAGALAGSQISFTANVEFNVAPGTPIEQQREIAETSDNAFRSFWDEKVREINNNHPEYE